MRDLNPDRHNQAGFTLLEMVMVVVIIGIVGGISGPVMVNYIEGAQRQQTRTTLIEEANIALMKLQNRALNISSNTSSDFTTQAHQLSFPTQDDEVYDYQINNGDLEQTVDSTTTSILSPHAQSLDFTYYDTSGNTTSTNSDTYYIKVKLKLSRDNESITSRRLIFLRDPGYDN